MVRDFRHQRLGGSRRRDHGDPHRFVARHCTRPNPPAAKGQLLPAGPFLGEHLARTLTERLRELTLREARERTPGGWSLLAGPNGDIERFNATVTSLVSALHGP